LRNVQCATKDRRTSALLASRGFNSRLNYGVLTGMIKKQRTTGSKRDSGSKPLTKSEQMRHVGTRNTGPELLMRKLLSANGVRFRLHRGDLPGKPDIYISRLRLAIFVNGCFWHNHDCPRGRMPKTNRGFWRPKLRRNKLRDAEIKKRLETLAIKTLEVWTCRTAEFPALCKSIARRYARKDEPP